MICKWFLLKMIEIEKVTWHLMRSALCIWIISLLRTD